MSGHGADVAERPELVLTARFAMLYSGSKVAAIRESSSKRSIRQSLAGLLNERYIVESTQHFRNGDGMPMVNFHISSERLAVIDQAAKALGISRTEFVLRSIEVAVVEALNERRVIPLDEKAWDDFVAALYAPVKIDPDVEARYARMPKWNQ